MRLFFVLLLLPFFVVAHPLSTAQVEAIFSQGKLTQLEASFKIKELFLEEWPDPNHQAAAVALPAGTDPKYRSFVAQYAAASVLSFDGVGQTPKVLKASLEDVPDEGGVSSPVSSLVIRFEVNEPGDAKSFQWTNDMPLGAYVLVLKEGAAGEPLIQWLVTGQKSEPFSLYGAHTQSTAQIILMYLWLGFTHILPLGMDHVLFVLGIFFLCTSLKPMLWQVSAFTLAHTITLALTAYGVISLPSSIVEPIIAVSIGYVGVENVLRRELKSSRVVLVFAFGLLHGMGFAGALAEIGLPQGALMLSLLSFNIGVELGQLAVILSAFLLIGVWGMRKEWYRKRVVIPASTLIAMMGLYWAIERTFF